MATTRMIQVEPGDTRAELAKQTLSAASGAFLAASIVGATIVPAFGVAAGAGAFYLIVKQILQTHA